MAKQIKRSICFLLCFLSFFSFFPNPIAYAKSPTYIENPNASDYVSDPTLQAALQSIFDGNIPLYNNQKCTDQVSTSNAKVGSGKKPLTGKTQYVGKEGGPYVSDAAECFIYANAVSYALFGLTAAWYGGNNAPEMKEQGTEAGGIRRSSKAVNTVYNKSQKTNDSYLITYNNFVDWGVSYGAVIRTVPFGTSQGHSMVVISYDEDYLYTLEGNIPSLQANLCKMSWDDYEKRDQKYIHYIVQPTEEYFTSLYPTQAYLPTVGEKEYFTYLQLRVINDNQGVKTRPGMDVTYADSTDIERTREGDIYTAIGLVRNIAGNYWYKVISNNGAVGYIYAGHMEVAGALEDNVTLSKPFPSELKVGSKRTLGGSVTAERTIIVSVTGQIHDSNGNSFEKTVNNINSKSYSFKGTAIDKAMTFGKLKKGDCEFVATVITTNYYSDGTELLSGDYNQTYTLIYSFTEK